jgi:hypothetical protein
MKAIKRALVSFVLGIIWRLQCWLTGYTNNPTCPWCGYPCPTEHNKEVVFDGDCEEIECFNCSRPYDRHTDLTFTFFTEKVER